MSVTRRNVIKGLGVGASAAAIMAYDGPRSIARALSMSLPPSQRPLLLHNNENPLGPGARVTRAMNEAMDLGLGSQYGLPSRQVIQAISETHDIPTESLMLGNGSTQILETITHQFVDSERGLVTAAPTFETCTDYANVYGYPVNALPLDENLKFDLEATARAARGAGVVFFCNPNNPTATLHEGDAVDAFLDRVLDESDALIIVDEAYFEYVTNPNHKTQIPRAIENPRVVVSRTFSKAHGMAGMRMGWLVGHPDTVSKLSDWQYGGVLNAPAILGAKASIEDPARIAEEVARNTAVRDFTMEWVNSRGLEATDSQTNFLFVRTGVPAASFREACAEHNVLVGRDFPPYQNEWMRISLGTMDEMERAVGVFDQVMTDLAGADGRRRDNAA